MKNKIAVAIIFLMVTITSFGASPPDFTEGTSAVYGQDTIHKYTHDQTGLEVVWIENKDERTCFTLGVKTPTTDSTGVNHIIEHSVFTGSSKYPSASLFFDANSVYPHIYMNASTSSDLTMYPFCTPYKESFEGLLNVYLDSILNPDMLNQPSNFYEESFYYDPGTKKFGGVVYNEMKGAGGSIGRIIFRSIRQAIYKDTHYANDSGGQAEVIPTLTYQQFVDTYQNYYYPQNMMIVLYGDLPINKVLGTIDGYFDKYTEKREAIDVNVEPTLSEKENVAYYDGGQSAFVIKSFIIKDQLTSEQVAELDLWTNTYMLDPSSYFIKNLKKHGIHNVEIYKDSELKYPTYSIVVGGIKTSEVEQVREVLENTLETMKSELNEEPEIEKNTIERTKLSYYQGDKSSTRGINIAQNIISAWVHEKELDQYYRVKEHITAIEDIQGNYMNILLNSPYVTVLDILPGDTAEAVDPLELSAISEQEWEGIVKEMRDWQANHQTAGLKEVNLKGLVMDSGIKYKKKKDEGIIYTLYQTESDLIASELYFPVDHIAQEQLPYLFLYPVFLEQAAREISPFEGNLTSSVAALENKSGYTPYLKIGITTSKHNPKQEELLRKARESLLAKSNAWYDDQLEQFLGGFAAQFQSDIIGTLTNLNMVGQEGSKRYMYEQFYPLFQKCVMLKKTGNTQFVEGIKAIDKLVGPTKGSYIGVMTDKATYEGLEERWKAYCQSNYIEQQEKQEYHFTKSDKPNIYYKKTNVDYLVYSYDKGKEYVDGLDYLSSSYITKNYLQPNIRVKKGAYGSGMNTLFPGSINIYTYRDPEYQTSMDIINNMVPILKAEVTKDRVEMAKSDAICDIQNQFGLLSTDIKKASVLQILMIMGVDIDYIVDMQKQIIKSDIEDVTKQIELMTEILKNSQIGVCTNKATIPTQSETTMYN
ncbi:MAG: insulinase family protein [Cellulosilyticaceae bacterium]